VTGNTGFKGSWLCRILVYAGADVMGYALAPLDKTNLYGLINLKNDIRPVISDIRSYKHLSGAVKSFKPEIVFHMAAQPLVRESYRAPVYTYETNVMGTVNLLEACRQAPCVRSIVNVTTDKVYENKEHDRGYREDENLCGFDPYSNSKSCSEFVTAAYRNSFYSNEDSPSLSTARSGNVIGGGDFAKDRIIPDCVRAQKSGKPVIVRNPRATRPYQHVLDCLSGYLLLAEKQYDRKLTGSYNFGPREKDVVNNADLVEMFMKAWGGGKSVHKHDGGPHEAGFLKLDCAKAKKKLGWKPLIPLKQAVELTVEWSKMFLTGGDFKECMDNQIKKYFMKG